MADLHCLVNQVIRLSDETGKISLRHPLAYDNSYAHCLRATVLDDDGEAADLTGITAYASAKRADNFTVTPIFGTISGNVVEVVLSPACYVIPGRITFTVNLVKPTSADGIPSFSSGTYHKGEKVVRNGTVYRFIEDHTGAWNDSHVTPDVAIRNVLWAEGTVERNVSDDLMDPGVQLGNAATVAATIQNAASAASQAVEAAAQANEIAAQLAGFDGTQILGSIGSLQNSYITDFEQGSWGYATPTVPTDTNHSKRIRTKFFYPVKAGMIVEFCLPTLQHYFALLSNMSDGTWAPGSESWTTTGHTTPHDSVMRYIIPSDGYFGVILRKDADVTNTSPSDFSGFIRLLTQDMVDLIDAKYDIDHHLDGICSLKSSDFVVGGYAYASYSRHNTRIRTERLIHVPRGTEVHYGTTGHEIYLGVLTSRTDYNNSPGYQGNNQTGWITGKGVYLVPFDGYLVCMERTVNDSAPLTPDSYSSNITIVYPEYKRFEKSLIKDKAGPSKRVFVKCGAEMPVISLSAEVTPNQSGSGDPSPTNVRDITARTGFTIIRAGKNICYMQNLTTTTATYTWNDDNTKVTITSKSNTAYSSAHFGTFTFLPNTVYTFSCRVKVLERTSYACKIAFRSVVSPYPAYALTLLPSGSDEQIVSCTWTPTEETTATANVMLTDQNAGTTSVEISEVQVEQSPVRTDYEPYSRNEILLNFPEACYGAKINADGYGNYQVTRTHVLFTTENITKTNITAVGAAGSSNTSFWIFPNYPFYGAPWHCCNRLLHRGNNTAGTEVGYYTSSSYTTSLRIVMPTSLVGNTQDSIHAYITANPLKFAAPLPASAQADLGVVVAEPLETSGGDNMIYNGDNNVTVEYFVDPSLKIAQLTASILNS